MIKRNFLLIIILVLVPLGFFLVNYYHPQKENIKYVKIGGQTVKVELAATYKDRERGLSVRGELREKEGMLFVFDRDGIYPFWMKDMNFPIDIIWINKDLKVVYIKKNATRESYPEIYEPKETALYVLEVGSEFSDKNNLQIGDSVYFTY